MTPVSFPEQNTIYGEGQTEYTPLPAHRAADGTVVSCWRLSFWARVKLIVTGRVWALTLTFGDPLQPLCLTTEKPFEPATAPSKEPVK